MIKYRIEELQQTAYMLDREYGATIASDGQVGKLMTFAFTSIQLAEHLLKEADRLLDAKKIHAPCEHEWAIVDDMPGPKPEACCKCGLTRFNKK